MPASRQHNPLICRTIRAGVPTVPPPVAPRFSGTLPSAIPTSLTLLDLRSNAISGTIPSSVGSLTGLTALSLNQNNFSGSIPESVAQLTGLVTIELQGNSLFGTIPTFMGSLTNVQWLDLSQNAMSGTVPAELAWLTHLYFLNLASNELSGTLPDALASLTDLMWVDVSMNSLTWDPPGFLPLIAVSSLNIAGNAFRGPVSSWALTTHPESIDTLTIALNPIGGALPDFTVYTSLQALDASRCGFAGAPTLAPGEQSVFKYGIQSINLFGNSLSGTVPMYDIFGSDPTYSSITWLDLGSNNYTGSVPSALGLSNVKHLSLAQNALSGQIPDSLGTSKLTFLDLSGNQLAGQIPNSLAENLALAGLLLSDNRLQDVIPTALGLFPQLSTCALSGGTNNFTCPVRAAAAMARVPRAKN
jgi:hypothetical protein